MTVTQLLERFTGIDIEQDQALLKRQYAKFNRLFEQMVAIKDELKTREGDQRREPLSLYKHPNAQVRLNAIKATLAVAPDIAPRALQALADSRDHSRATQGSRYGISSRLSSNRLSRANRHEARETPGLAGMLRHRHSRFRQFDPATFQARRALWTRPSLLSAAIRRPARPRMYWRAGCLDFMSVF
jgi:hypothetical protein